MHIIVDLQQYCWLRCQYQYGVNMSIIPGVSIQEVRKKQQQSEAELCIGHEPNDLKNTEISPNYSPLGIFTHYL